VYTLHIQTNVRIGHSQARRKEGWSESVEGEKEGYQIRRNPTVRESIVSCRFHNYFLLAVLRPVVLLADDLALALVAAALALGLASLVELVAFFAAGRFEVAFLAGALVVVVFLVVVAGAFLAGALALAVVADAVFLAGALEVAEEAAEGFVLLFVTAFLPEAFGGLVSFLTVLAAGLTGLFSLVALASSDLPLAASLTFPEGPLGSVKTPFSSPLMMARLIFELTAAVISKRYFSSKYFLIVGLDTPVRASSLLTMHSEIMMMKEGCDDGDTFFLGAAFLAGAFLDGEDICGVGR